MKEVISDYVLNRTLDRYLQRDPVEMYLSTDEIESSEDWDELEERYTENGFEFDSAKELYDRARQEWWQQTRKDAFEPVEGLPGDEVAVTYDAPDGTTYDATVHIHGINHGDIGLQLDDTVKKQLQQAVQQFADTPGSRVYIEERVDPVVFDNMSARYDNVYELDDRSETGRDLTAEPSGSWDPDAAHSPRSALRGWIRKCQKKPVERLAAVYDQDPWMDVIDMLYRSRNGETTLSDIQNAAESLYLPYHLEQGYRERRIPEIENDLDTYERDIDVLAEREPANIVETVSDWTIKQQRRVEKLGPELRKGWLEWFRQEFSGERSEHMANRALEALYEDEVTDIHIVAGAAHQPEIRHHLENLSEDDLDEYYLHNVHGVEPGQSRHAMHEWGYRDDKNT